IMMIDVALEVERNQGKKPVEAIYDACILRFRPIMMTTMAALLGGLPLALGHGTGSELHRPLGITIVGGLIVSQALTLFTTPVVYVYLYRLRLALRGGEGDAVPRMPPSISPTPADNDGYTGESSKNGGGRVDPSRRGFASQIQAHWLRKAPPVPYDRGTHKAARLRLG